MHLEILVDDGLGHELYQWLEDDSELRRYATIQAGGAVADTMGVGDVIDIVLTHATAISGLAVAIASFCQARPQPVWIRLRLPNRQVLSIHGDPDTVERLVTQFLTSEDEWPPELEDDVP